MTTIATLTMNPALDMFLEAPRVEPDRKIRASRPTFRAGGGGINVSRAIRRLRGTSVAIFPCGGAAGEALLTQMTREGIETRPVPIYESTRENVNVTDLSNGSEYRFIVPGPQLGITEWQECLKTLQRLSPAPDYVVASGTLPAGAPVDFYARLAALATEMNFRLVVDSSGEPLRYAATKGTFLLKPNVRELAYIAGQVPASDADVEAAARFLVTARSVGAVVVSTGAAGALLVEANGATRIAAPLVPIASRIGAGDSLVAGIAIALARGGTLEEAVRYGVAAGASAVMAKGHHLCGYDETERLFGQLCHEEVTA